MSEFSRPLRLDAVGTQPRDIAIEAGPEELQALARRFDIASLASLGAQASAYLQGGDVRATGTLEARLVQLCVATNVELPASISENFDILFRSEQPGEAPEGGLELSEGECDVVFFDGMTIDLGEAVADTLALAIDSYPRAPGADAALKEMGVLGEDQAGPFAALAALKRE